MKVVRERDIQRQPPMSSASSADADAHHLFSNVRAFVSLRVDEIGQVLDALKFGGATCLGSSLEKAEDPTHVICTAEEYDHLRVVCMRSATFASWPHFVTSAWVFETVRARDSILDSAGRGQAMAAMTRLQLPEAGFVPDPRHRLSGKTLCFSRLTTPQKVAHRAIAEHMGARVVDAVDDAMTHLVCERAEGPKYLYAVNRCRSAARAGRGGRMGGGAAPPASSTSTSTASTASASPAVHIVTPAWLIAMWASVASAVAAQDAETRGRGEGGALLCEEPPARGDRSSGGASGAGAASSSSSSSLPSSSSSSSSSSFSSSASTMDDHIWTTPYPREADYAIYDSAEDHHQVIRCTPQGDPANGGAAGECGEGVGEGGGEGGDGGDGGEGGEAGAGGGDDPDESTQGDDEDDAGPGRWSCRSCTYVNPAAAATCDVCNKARGGSPRLSGGSAGGRGGGREGKDGTRGNRGRNLLGEGVDGTDGTPPTTTSTSSSSSFSSASSASSSSASSSLSSTHAGFTDTSQSTDGGGGYLSSTPTTPAASYDDWRARISAVQSMPSSKSARHAFANCEVGLKRGVSRVQLYHLYAPVCTCMHLCPKVLCLFLCLCLF